MTPPKHGFTFHLERRVVVNRRHIGPPVEPHGAFALRAIAEWDEQVRAGARTQLDPRSMLEVHPDRAIIRTRRKFGATTGGAVPASSLYRLWIGCGHKLAAYMPWDAFAADGIGLHPDAETEWLIVVRDETSNAEQTIGIDEPEAA
jgi:hypothetical protein